MISSLVRVTDAATEPVTLAEAQAFLNVDSDADSDLIESLITTARQRVEDFTGRALISQTWKLVQSDWPCSKAYNYARANTWAERTIELHRSPLISVQSVKYYPASGAAQATLSAATYTALTGPTPGLIVLASTESWPDLYDRPDAVEVNFTAGYADADSIPKPLRHAVLLLLADLYELRSTQVVGNIVNELPTVKALLESYRVGGWVA